MATIVNNPGPERVIEVGRTGDGMAGWAIAVIILIAVVLALFGWIHYHRAPAAQPAAQTGPSINVTLPGGGVPSGDSNPPADSGAGASAQ